MTMTRLGQLAPGLILAITVAVISRQLGNWLPQLGGATIAILLGIVLGNTFFKQGSLNAGTQFAESKLLEFSVVLLGASVTFQTITQLGLTGFGFIAIQMSLTILIAYQLGRKLGFNTPFALMMAGGNAVCGSSAVASIAPTVGASEEDKGQVITLVNLMGTVMMLLLPLLSQSWFHYDLIQSSALIGGTLQSVGQVVAGASLLSPEVVQMAMIFKIIRITALVFVVMAFERIARKQQSTVTTSAPKSKKINLPWYVLAFLIVCTLNSLLPLPELFTKTAHFTSTWFETTALAAIGLRLNLKKFLQEGPRFLVYGSLVGLAQTLLAVTLIKLFAL